MACASCPYEGSRIIPYVGVANADIMIVGEAPTKEDIKLGKPFTGRAGALLLSLIESVGLQKSDVIVANALKCGIDITQKKKITLGLKHCREHLANTINKHNPKIIVALGAVALQQVLKVKKINANRGRIMQSKEFNCDVLVTTHPNLVLRSASRNYPNIPYDTMTMKERVIIDDFKLLKDYLTNDFTHKKMDTTGYKAITADQIADYFDSNIIATDYEATGVEMRKPETKVLSISFSDGRDYTPNGKPKTKKLSGVYLVKDKKLPSEMKKLLTDTKIKKVLAGRPFDELLTRHKCGYEIKGVKHDILTMAYLLDENYYAYNLEIIANTYTDLKNIKDIGGGTEFYNDPSKVTDAELVERCGGDTDATMRAFKVLAEKLKAEPKLLRYYLKFMLPMQDMFAEIVDNGVTIDMEAFHRNEEAATTLINELHTQAISLLPKLIRDEHEKKGLSLTRRNLLIDMLFKHPKGLKRKPQVFTKGSRSYIRKLNAIKKAGRELTEKEVAEIYPNIVPSTAEDHLKLLAPHPFIEAVMRWVKADKIKSTYFPQILKNRQADGKVYPQTLFTRSVNRTSMVGPTIQNIPQRGEFAHWIKELFVADDGWVIGARDLSQSELRIIGWISHDPNILDALQQNIDLHTKTARDLLVPIFGNVDITGDLRQKAKPVNFGFCISEGQLVLTDMGLLPIEDVTVDNLVWDGIEFVKHDGVIYQGIKEVIEYAGLTATPDHKVYTTNGLVPFEKAKRERLTLLVGECNGSSVKIPYANRETDKLQSRQLQTYRSSLSDMWKSIRYPFRQLAHRKDNKLSMCWQVYGTTTSQSFGRQVRCTLSTVYQFQIGLLPKLRGAWNTMSVSFTQPFHYMGTEKLTAPDLQKGSDRPGKQQRALCSWEFETCNTAGKSLQYPQKQKGIIQRCISSASSFVASLKNRLSKSSLQPRMGSKTVKTGTNPRTDNNSQPETPKWEKVYDILNAGPNHRFTVSGKLVSNCYDQSPEGFQKYAKDEYGVDFTIEQCYAIREAFFAKPKGYWKLPIYHKERENEALAKGYVETVLGRRRRLPDIYSSEWGLQSRAKRQAINFPVSSFSSDLGLIGMYMAYQTLKRLKLTEHIKLCWFIHDAVWFMAKRGYIDEAMKILKQSMEYDAKEYIKKEFGVTVGYPIASDGKYGLNWNTMEKYTDK